MDNMHRQLYSGLVNAFAGRLRGVEANGFYAGDIVNFSENLTSFSFKCDVRSLPVLPQVNILPLKKLHLSHPPADFSWDYFQRNPGSNESVVFPNLRDLVLNFSIDRDIRLEYARSMVLELDTATGKDQVMVQFPNLRKLHYHGYSYNPAFQPEVVSPHLDKVYIVAPGDKFCAFSKLPIKSIGSLEVKVHQAPSNIVDFRKATDRLFNEIANSSDTEVRVGPFGLKILNDVR